MPEMPEVETLARQLRRTVVGKRIGAVWQSGKALRRPIAGNFAEGLQGRTIRRILRRGKYLVAEMDPKAYWLIHLGMSGRILYHARAGCAGKHTHAVIRFSDSTELEYRDSRRFGLLAAYEVRRLEEVPEIRALGKDPLGPGFDQSWLWPLLCRSRRDVKSFLLDQRRIAGLGNIYACEALFEARIHPARRCHRIGRAEAVRLVAAIQAVLRLAVRHRGTSFSDFMDSVGNPGRNQHNLRVFHREGEGCVRCGERIRRFRQANRSSFFCPRCQNIGD